MMKFVTFTLSEMLQDLFIFEPDKVTWTQMTEVMIGNPPSPREWHGFTAAAGLLYVFGGFGGPGCNDQENICCEERARPINIP